VRDLLKEMLEGEDCEVMLAASGNEALATFRDSQFDAVCTDVGMPGMSGWELAREIRHLDHRIPIAVITGWGEAVGSNEQKAAGVDWVIAKPFTTHRVAELVRDINLKRESMKVKSISIVAA
jgi:CheY-like chemotaxis protein